MNTTYQVIYSDFAKMYQVWIMVNGTQNFCLNQFKTEAEAEQCVTEVQNCKYCD